MKRFIIGGLFVTATLVIWLLIYLIQSTGAGDQVHRFSTLSTTGKEEVLDALLRRDAVPPNDHQISFLLVGLKDKDYRVRQRAIMFFSSQGSRALPHLLRAAFDDDPILREGAILSLGKFDWSERGFSEIDDRIIASVLFACLDEARAPIRAACAKSLWPAAIRSGKQQKAINALGAVLNDEDERVRTNATLSIGFISRYSVQKVRLQHVAGLLKERLKEEKSEKGRYDLEWAVEEIEKRKKRRGAEEK